MTRIDLPGGGWADIKDPADLTNRDRKLLRRHGMAAFTLRDKLAASGVKVDQSAIRSVDDIDDDTAMKIGAALTADDLDLLDQSQASFIVVFTAAWSLDLPLPTMDTVDDLPGPIFDALAKATATLGDGTLDTAIDVGDKSSPTGPSGSSDAA